MNDLGDVELDSRGMRALAHPVRMAILLHLRRQGPSTATRLAPLVGASPSVTSWHLRHLAEHGLVEDVPDPPTTGRSRWWQAVGRGFRFDVDPADPAPGLALRDVLEQAEGDLVGQWTAQVRPRLEPQWLAVADRGNTGMFVTAQEAAELNAAIESPLAPLVQREPADAPAGARWVRLLRYTLPDVGSDD